MKTATTLPPPDLNRSDLKNLMAYIGLPNLVNKQGHIQIGQLVNQQSQVHL